MAETSSLALERKLTDFKAGLTEKKGRKGVLIPMLQAAQDTFGYIPEQVIYDIGEVTAIPLADIYGVITFYAQFRLKPLGKHLIRICEGTACHVNGAKSILRALQDELGIMVGETTGDGLFTLESVACLGCCSLSPVIMVDDETFANLNQDRTRAVVKKFRTRQQEKSHE